MIYNNENIFHLQTKETSYIFSILDTGHLQHLYYGKRVREGYESVLIEPHAFAPGNTIQYDSDHLNFSLEDMKLEMSSIGKGDIREPFIEIIYGDQTTTCDFLFDSFGILDHKTEFKTLPGSYGDCDHLEVVLKDKNYNVELQLHYYVYEDCDVITRSSTLVNKGSESIQLNRLMSTQLDFDQSDLMFTSFHGSWANEMEKNDVLVSAGKYVSESFTGTSSSRSNPFVMIHSKETQEYFGNCIGCNLIYSGNHYECFEATTYGKSRFVSGIQPRNFSFCLNENDTFEAPEAVMTFSSTGFHQLSSNMHSFVQNHIVRKEWSKKVRPVLLNSWEACYFDINESKLLKLAKEARDCGIELFVMDDGWFSTRNNDHSGLGDWSVNKKKLPHGLQGLQRKLKEMGLEFGIWVEPEMVNVDSYLYKEHPEWVIQNKNSNHSEGRNQRILDLSLDEVQDYIINEMSRLFSSADISYVKWDMNRIFSDYCSSSTPSEELNHRYVIGLYRVMKELTNKFPQILFEGCAAGGNRFDLGILAYFPQIWPSDNTDTLVRVGMIENYSYGYPLSVLSAHVCANVNHQTLRKAPLQTRFNVSCFGLLGYELNLVDLSAKEKKKITNQIKLYKKNREIFQFGKFYRVKTGNIHEWTIVNQDCSLAVGLVMQELVNVNHSSENFIANGLDENKLYHFYNLEEKLDIRDFGDLVNTQSPIHIKNDSLIQNIVAKYVELDGEVEDIKVYGDTLMYSGIPLKQAYSGTGISNEIRHFPDFSSRMYFIEEVDINKKS